MKNVLVLALMVLGLLSCEKQFIEPCEVGSTEAQIVDRTGLDGCGLMIQLDKNTFLEPINLEDFGTFSGGEKITLTYQTANDRASICMAGEIVEILCLVEQQ